MASVRDIARSTLIWAGFAGVTLAAFPPLILGYPLVLVDPERALSDWYFRQIGKALVRINPLWSIRVEGRERLRNGGPYILVVNHQSMADLIAMCFLDHPTKYLGKKAAFDVPIFGWALKIAGYVGVERGNRESGARAIEELRRWLERGVSVAIFPEGTRSGDGSIGPFKVGAFKLAIETGRPIAPIVISGAAEVLPKHSIVFERHANVTIHVLPPVPTKGLAAKDASRLSDEVRAQMVEALSAGC